MPKDYPFGLEDLNKELESELDPGDEFTEEDFEELKIEGAPESRPHFPLVTFVFALLLDIIKISTLGFLGIFVAILGHILVRIYLIGKMGFIKRWMWKKALIKSGVSSIPLIGAFLASWSWFIFRAHAKYYKRIDQLITAVENLIMKKSKNKPV